MRRSILAAAVLWACAMGPAGAAADMQGGYGRTPVVRPDQLAERMRAGGAKTLGLYWVDLRNEADYKRSFIPGSINIPYAKLSFLAEKFFSRSDEIVFLSYPDADHVSVNAVTFMKNKGFVNCSVLQGGIGGWTGDLETSAPDNR